MPRIEYISAQEVLDSRGNPTVQATVRCSGGHTGSASVPSGVSTGKYEVHELRDHDEKRYGGLGVLNAVAGVKGEIHAALLGKTTANQTKIDSILLQLDGTENKSRLGGNAILAVSLACARAEASYQGLPLYLYLQQLYPKRDSVMPVPQMNLVNGGEHVTNGLSIQEFQIMPIGSSNFSEALRMGAEVYHALHDILVERGLRTEVGDEGGFAPVVENSEAVFDLLVRAIEVAGYVPGVDAFISLDVAASGLYDEEDNMYFLDGVRLDAQALAYKYKTWKERYPVISLEDPFHEDRWDEWSSFVKKHGDAVQVIGDDLYATNAKRIREGIVRGATNAVLIKPNQIGTLTETLQSVLVAQEAGQNVVVSHRSGETGDTFIADLAVAVGAGQIKTGAPARSDRTGKYNRLLEIDSAIHGKLSHSLQPFLEHQVPRYAQADGMQIVSGRSM